MKGAQRKWDNCVRSDWKMWLLCKLNIELGSLLENTLREKCRSMADHIPMTSYLLRQQLQEITSKTTPHTIIHMNRMRDDCYYLWVAADQLDKARHHRRPEDKWPYWQTAFTYMCNDYSEPRREEIVWLDTHFPVAPVKELKAAAKAARLEAKKAAK